jgi:hypothetical protein
MSHAVAESGMNAKAAGTDLTKSVRITPRAHARLERLCKLTGWGMGYAVAQLIDAELQRRRDTARNESPSSPPGSLAG